MWHIGDRGCAKTSRRSDHWPVINKHPANNNESKVANPNEPIFCSQSKGSSTQKAARKQFAANKTCRVRRPKTQQPNENAAAAAAAAEADQTRQVLTALVSGFALCFSRAVLRVHKRPLRLPARSLFSSCCYYVSSDLFWPTFLAKRDDGEFQSSGNGGACSCGGQCAGSKLVRAKTFVS